jgi:hypothetical protein
LLNVIKHPGGVRGVLPPILKLLRDQQAIHSVAEVVTEGLPTIRPELPRPGRVMTGNVHPVLTNRELIQDCWLSMEIISL